ncbi:lipid II:glycine glycyltransferase FemX [Candidatus Moduliflexota bacterium]
MRTGEESTNMEIVAAGREEWDSILPLFDGATIYQTWSYGEVRWGESQLNHVIMKLDNDIVGAAQVRTMTIPGVGSGIAYIPFGPLWRRPGIEPDAWLFRRIINALYEEYVVKRGLLLRLLPLEWEGGELNVESILCDAGLDRQISNRPYRTFLIDLSLSGEELRKSLDPKWRGHLNRSGRSGLTIIEGKDDALYGTFAEIYGEMHSRKLFAEFVNIDEIREVQKDLPDHLKMTILVALKESEPVASLVCSAIGGTAVYYLGASSAKGRKLAASYALQWAMIERLQERGCRWYDLGGTDPEDNPGTHSFKRGLAGKAGKEAFSVGQYDGCRNIASSVTVRIGDGFRGVVAKRRLKETKHVKKAST